MEHNIIRPSEVTTVLMDTLKEKKNHSFKRVMLLGIMAGFVIAFGGFLATSITATIDNFSVARFLSGAVFPVGLIVVVITGLELFTGNSMLIIPTTHGLMTWKQYGKILAASWFFNLIGSVLLAVLLFLGGHFTMGTPAVTTGILNAAMTRINMTLFESFISGIICNIIVCLAIYLSAASRDVAGKVLVIWFLIMGFVVAGLQHSVANMYFLSAGLIAKMVPGIALEGYEALTIWNSLTHLITVSIGNLIGGAGFVGLLYYHSYIKDQRRPAQDDPKKPM